jgi:type II secretory pathway component GspD/PulD (secretin)
MHKKTELVIFITPYIYDASSALNQANIAKGEEINRKFQNIVEGKSLLE